MEAEKILISIEAGIESLRRLGVFADTGADVGRDMIQKGLHMIRQSIEQQAARDNLVGTNHEH